MSIKIALLAVKTRLTRLLASKGQPNGLCTLDANAKVPNNNMPFGVVDALSSDSATSALSAKQGKVLDNKINNVGTLNNVIDWTDVSYEVQAADVRLSGKYFHNVNIRMDYPTANHVVISELLETLQAGSKIHIKQVGNGITSLNKTGSVDFFPATSTATTGKGSSLILTKAQGNGGNLWDVDIISLATGGTGGTGGTGAVNNWDALGTHNLTVSNDGVYHWSLSYTGTGISADNAVYIREKIKRSNASNNIVTFESLAILGNINNSGLHLGVFALCYDASDNVIGCVGGVVVAGSTTGKYLYSYLFNGDFNDVSTLTNLSEGGNYQSIGGLNNQASNSDFDTSKTYTLEVNTVSRGWAITCSDGTFTSGYGSLPIGTSYIKHVVSAYVTDGMSAECAFSVANH
jgi:hypothetical protein